MIAHDYLAAGLAKYIANLFFFYSKKVHIKDYSNLEGPYSMIIWDGNVQFSFWSLSS